MSREHPLILPELPVGEALPALRAALRDAGGGVLVAPPGSGKTTLVPLALMAEPWLEGRRVVMLEPRRLATRQAAFRMAELLGEQPGGTIGYAMRFERCRGSRTRVEVLTEGLFVRRLQADPGLDGVGLVIFDEFHERSLDADLGLGLAREVQATLRPDLRLLVMSATLDADAIAGWLGARVVTAEGRRYPVTIHYRPDSPPESVIGEALRAHQGDLLVFLPGAAEIERLAGRLAGLPAEIHRLHGSLPRAAQDAALRPSPGRRRIVLATNIAETSLTIEGIEAVIDTGLARRSRYSPRTGMSRLDTVRISRASAEQRAGRAGRLGPGHAYRLWPEAETRGLAMTDPPEIAEADLCGLVLELALWGVRAADDLALPTPPPAGGFAAAQALLRLLGGLAADGSPTPHGRAMAALPLHPRLAHMVLKAGGEGAGTLAAALALAALAGDRDPWAGRLGPDLAERLADWGNAPDRLRQLHRQLCRALKADAAMPPDPAAAGRCAALAFPDRLAMRRGIDTAELRLANGRGARLGDAKAFAGHEHVVVWESEDRGSDALVRLAAGLSRVELEAVAGERIETVVETRFDPASGAVLGEERRQLGALVLASRPAAVPAEAIGPALLAALRRHGLDLLPWTDELKNLRQRLAFLAAALPMDWSPVDDATLLAGLDEWLAPWLADLSRLRDLAPRQLGQALLGRLDPARLPELDRLAPASWTGPLGAHPIDYATAPPVLACRLQELLGLDRHPAILDGRQPLSLHLLSPAGRPIQITLDLPGFWRGSYQEVRKALRGRYPKHPWPEDPLTASPWRPGRRS